jgi:predicted alpha/beta-hydrolase family hydrolase
VAAAFADGGYLVLRCDLPFRQARPTGPPSPSTGGRDREGLRRAVAAVGRLAAGPVFLGGHSYGGRQASLLAAEDPGLAGGLLLLAYPLRPPRGAAEPRTAHFPRLRTPSLFVHGSRDPFGTLADVQAALGLIPAPAALLPVEGAGHDLLGRRRGGGGSFDVPGEALAAFERLIGRPPLLDTSGGAA